MRTYKCELCKEHRPTDQVCNIYSGTSWSGSQKWMCRPCIKNKRQRVPASCNRCHKDIRDIGIFHVGYAFLCRDCIKTSPTVQNALDSDDALEIDEESLGTVELSKIKKSNEGITYHCKDCAKLHELITAEQREKLLENGHTNVARILEDSKTEDFWPVVKLFFPWGDQTWLISELDPENEDRAFGLADLGLGCPELGYIDLKELREFRWIGGLHVERDIYFKPKKSLNAYAEEARELGFICT